ncbi:type I-E CRISPR-associated protein Cse1/CasA [Nesterenkonia sp. CL21]|uniref:type I-E CRISPR-associated protein Cse1/CasA n=1 Tax=Nesterenkonia sp. CL21 TaxID=3064894 RepID=UPI002879CB4C|nr:type I-E CRISPR-associated protein Cse1/CasA [Nesterenkonia sp. CL21]MDS2172677.1 type I-E CRISPR-associated protein Cse1/CasA [Nesterenkonia sp. CL21]
MPTSARPPSTPAPTTTSQEFNLLDNPWISCLMLDGSTTELSLREVYLLSPEISRISGESPLQSAAVLRVVLAAFWRGHLTHGGLASRRTRASAWWLRLFEAPDGPELYDPVLNYLEEHRRRFDLLDTSAPFMQVADLQKQDGSILNVRRLIPEAESDYFTMREGPGRDALSLAEAARWLITAQAYDYSGIKPGAVGDPRVKNGKGYPIGPGWSGQAGVVILHGSSLAETLMLNTTPSTIRRGIDDEPDAPAWERAPHTAAPRHIEASHPTGPCDAVTWQSRRIRLHLTDDLVTGLLISNGDKIVTKNQFEDPMTGYRYSRNQSSKSQDVFMAREHQEDLTVWRGVPGLLVREGVVTLAENTPPGQQPATVEWLHGISRDDFPEDRLVHAELVGAVYGAQQSSHANTISSTVPFQLNLLTAGDSGLVKAAVDAVSSALEATVALGQFVGALGQAAGGDYAFHAASRQAALHSLAESFEDWLIHLGPSTDRDTHQARWHRTVRGIVLDHARIQLDGANPAALTGRLIGDERPRLVSASTAWSSLLRRLTVALPQSTPATPPPAEQEKTDVH